MTACALGAIAVALGEAGCSTGGASNSSSAGAISTTGTVTNDNPAPEQTIDIPIDDGSTYLADLEFEPDHLLVQVIPGSLLDAQALASSVGASVANYDDRTRLMVMSVPSDQLGDTAVKLAGMPEVEQIERDVRLVVDDAPNDPFYQYQWALPQVHAEQAWAVTTGDPNVIVAVVDSGIDSNHPDLRPRLVPGYNFVGGNTDAGDCCGHGTEVAGVIGAVANNSIGTTGIDWNARIMPVRVARAENGQTIANPSAVAAGVIWAVDQGAKVINVSFSGVLSSPAIQTACQYAFRNGRVVVAAMGNSAARDATSNSPYTVSVSATDSTDKLATFSTFGPGVDLGAPGVDLLTTAMGGNYVQASGTSFSSPLTAGVAALMWSERPEATAGQIVDLLLGAAEPLTGDANHEQFGHGRLSASAAVAAARDAKIDPDTKPPSVAFTAPTDHAEIVGKVRVELDAGDDRLVRDVVLSLDGSEIARDSSAPYAFLLDSKAATPGKHTLTAYAEDAAGNKSSAATLNVTIDAAADTTPPEIEFLSPAENAPVSGRVDVMVRMADPDGLARVALLLDGRQLVAQSISGSAVRVRFNWNASAAGVTTGPHTLTVVAINRAGLNASAALDVLTSQ